MTPFHFSNTTANQLLINPRAPEKESKDLLDLKNDFEKHFRHQGFFLVPSSGSSTTENKSVKLIALHHEAVLNSARRVNQYFGISSKEKWGCVLPTFHVAGLGIYARAYLLQAEVVQGEWNPARFSECVSLQGINIISLVPTQIFDLVQRRVEAPSCVRVVFVGGAKLSTELKEQIRELNWPIVETYGMTETGSMIACAQESLFEVLPGVEVETYDGKLKINCNSLMTCALQKVDNEIRYFRPQNDGLLTEDRAEIIVRDKKTYLNLQGRDQDYIKINGEGVSVTLLRELFGDQTSVALIPLPDERSEFQIAAVYVKEMKFEVVQQLIQRYNSKVRPFEKIRRIYQVDQLPKSELGKIKYKILEQTVQGIKEYETL